MKTVSAGPAPIAVQFNSAAEAAIFKQGDTVAKLSSSAAMELATVDHVTADTVFLRSSITGLGAGDTLATVTLKNPAATPSKNRSVSAV